MFLHVFTCMGLVCFLHVFVFMVYFLSFVSSFVQVIACASDCLERLTSKMTYFVSCGM